MTRLNFILAAVTVLLVASCNKQEGNKLTYHLEGTTEALADGEKLLIVDTDGQPIDSMVVNNGKFSYKGETDSVCFYSLIVKSDEMNGVSFFTEPGTIRISMGATPEQSKVEGTVANNAWQKLSEETAPYYEKIHEIEEIVYADTTLSSDSEWALGERYMQIYSEINKKIIEAAEANYDNEMGYLLLTRFIDPAENTQLMGELIAKLPNDFRQRQRVKELEATLKAFAAIETGQKIEDFALNTPKGEPMSVMSEVQKNKVTILDFWASWCGSCRREMPFMKELYAEYHPKGLGIIGISLDESAADWTRAINELGLEWPQISDLKGWSSSAAQTFQVNAIPFMIVLDSEGKILQKDLRGEDLKKFIDGLL